MKREAKAPITAVVITKNEEAAIGRCLEALAFCDQVLVIDSHSTDRTSEIARDSGAEVIAFTWNHQYPKKKQWGMEHPHVRHHWVLHVDADEIVTPKLARAMTLVVTSSVGGPVAYELPLAYHFMGKRLRFGHRVHKRSLVDRRYVRFPEVGDLGAPGITEVEGHYQPDAHGTVGRLNGLLIHDDPDPLGDWIGRHNKYSDWESYLRTHADVRAAVRSRRSRGGRVFDAAGLKPLLFFFYAYIIRFGFLDGRAGLDYAIGLSFYYWQIGAKTRELSQRHKLKD